MDRKEMEGQCGKWLALLGGGGDCEGLVCSFGHPNESLSRILLNQEPSLSSLTADLNE